MKISKEQFKENLVREEWREYKNKIHKTKEKEVRYYFVDRRINQKYIQLCRRYENIKILDWNMMFSECIDIIFEILGSMKKDYIYISENEKKDDISYIITTMEQRINDKINRNWTKSYRDRSGGDDVTVSVEAGISLDETVKDDEGNETTRGDLIGEDDIIKREEKTDAEIDTALEKIYADARLTERQIEVLQALEKTEDNYKNGEIYTKVDAAEILGTGESNVRKTFHAIKNKVIDAYDGKAPILNKKTRQEKIKILETLVDNIEDEKDIVEFVKTNMEEEFMYYLLYDSDIDADLVGCFNRNKDNDIHNTEMKKFCTYFLKEVYNYIELLKYNDSMSRIKVLPIRNSVKKEYTGNRDGEVKRYLRYDKISERQRIGEYIVINDEVYYLVNDDVEMAENV